MSVHRTQSPPTGRRGPPTGGFTLVELVVAVAILAILAVFAYPSFMSSVRKSRRADALEALMRIQLEQERYRSSNTRYGSLAEIGLPATTVGGHYTLAVIAPAAGGYTATATAVAGDSQVDDTAAGVSCATLTVNQDAPVFNPAGQTACWSR